MQADASRTDDRSQPIVASDAVLAGILRAAAAAARAVTCADDTAGVVLSPTEWSAAPVAASEGMALPHELVRLVVRMTQRGRVVFPGVRSHPGLARAAARADLGAVAAVSFSTATGRGCVIAARRKRTPFSAAEVARLEGVAACTERALAVATSAFEAERRDLIRVLHDNLGQTLTSLVFALDDLETRLEGPEGHARAAAAGRIARKAVRDLRESIAGTHRGSVAKMLPTLATLVNDLSRSGVSVTLDVDAATGALLPAVVECASHIARESLLNVKRHAHASRVAITFTRISRGRAVELVVSDDGRGFHIGDVGHSAWGGFGLGMMRERAAEIGGTLAIESTVGHGTQVFARLPCTLLGANAR